MTIKAVLIPFDEAKPVEAIDLAPGLDAIYERVAPAVPACSRSLAATRSTCSVTRRAGR